jgi:hypothetical protein
LRAVDAKGITIDTLQTPSTASLMTAMRSSGYFNLADQQSIWAQYSTYIAGDNTRGLLVEHSIFVKADCVPALTDDITRLSHTIHNAFDHRVRSPHAWLPSN